MDGTFETWENVRTSSIICVCYLYLSVCLIVFCLITQVKRFVSIRRGKNTIRGLSIDKRYLQREYQSSLQEQ